MLVNARMDRPPYRGFIVAEGALDGFASSDDQMFFAEGLGPMTSPIAQPEASGSRNTLHPRGVNHLALATCDMSPVSFERPAVAVAQSRYDPTAPNMNYSEKHADSVMGMPDDVVWERLSETTPPVQP